MASLNGLFRGLLGQDKYGDQTDAERTISMQEDLNKLKFQNDLKYLQHMPSAEVAGLQNAGINPITAFNGGAHSAMTAGNAGTPDVGSNVKGLTSAVKVGAQIAIAIATKNPKVLFGGGKK